MKVHFDAITHLSMDLLGWSGIAEHSMVWHVSRCSGVFKGFGSDDTINVDNIGGLWG